ncbi:MAG: tetratricopeptide repeat protein [Rikenellaceae bacterium]|nr:tetratricopeptide repeat protein [Rikenellaceae bacterium]
MKRLKLTLSFVLMSALTVGLFAQTVQNLNEKFNAAGQAMQEKKYDEAIQGFEEVITMGSAVGEGGITYVDNAKKYLPAVYVAYGRQNAAAKNYDKAIEILERAQDIATEYGDISNKNSAGSALASVYLLLGSDAYNSKDYAKAVEVFAKGYAAAPNNTQLALFLADSYDQLGNFDEAAEIYKNIMYLTHDRHAEAVVKAKEEYSKSLLKKASAAAQENNLDLATQYADEILSFDAENGDAVLLPIQVANNAKRYPAVINRASTIDAIQDADKKSNAYFLLGVAYQNTENTAKAIEAYKKVTSGSYVNQAKSAIADLSE